MAVTINTIAKHTGLSRQTVAFVLGDRPHLFREETRNKVFEAAERLGYRRNAAAVAMTRGRYNALGLLQTSKVGLGLVHGNMLAALMEEMRVIGMHLSLGQVDDEVLTDEAALPNLMNAWAVDGLIISYVADFPQRLTEILERYRLPAIWTNVVRPFDAVHPDDYGGVREATRRLLEMGHRSIGFLRYHEFVHYSCAARSKGYQDAMTAAGLQPRMLGRPVDVSLPHHSRHFDVQCQDVDQWLSAADRPTAVIVDDDEVVPILVHQCALKGIAIGRDMSVIQVSRDLLAPLGTRLATARVPTGDIGHMAVPLLLKKIKTPETQLPTVAVPYHFVHMDSSCVAVKR
ncbi:MAG TPA: LacI family DNA-binding transcriptional regulator [Tepidisphaeraceae bacterium]|jgi:LacI family transcriptional regulator|nr:LacI family DNA-binding transcriptional regulator [Tepidisphaeraceae bacterium]